MKLKKGVFISSMITPAMILLLVLSVFPLVYTIRNSFTDYYLLSKDKANFIWLDNYIKICQDPYFRIAVVNTVKFTILGVCLETILGMFFALFVHSIKIGNKIIRTLLLLPMLLPPVTVALIWQTMFSNNYGIINQILGLLHIAPINWLMDVNTAFLSVLVIDIWQYTPLTFLLIFASLQAVPTSQYEAASMDGANKFMQFIHITLPNIREGLGMVILLRTIDTFRLFDKINILTKGGPANSTSTITQYIYQYGTKNLQIGYSSAASVIMTVIVMCMAVFYLKKSMKNLK